MFKLFQELSDGDVNRLKGLLKASPVSETKMPDDIPDEAKFKFKISSEAVDRDGEVVKANGIDMKWYKKNPIVLLNHWYSVENIIGKCTRIWQEGTDTYAEGYFSQTNPKAKLVQDLYNEKMVNVVSIGFIVKERDPNDRNTITKSELLEFSICAVQSNRDAERTDDQKALIKKGIEAGLIVDEEKVGESKNLAKKEKDATMEKDTIDLSEFSSLMWDLTKDLRESIDKLAGKIESIEKSVKTIADDKVTEEKRAVEEAKNLKKKVQELAKGASAYLENAKKL